MTIAAQLPKSTLDIRGDRLRFQLANALNECEAQYRRGQTDKATNTVALLNAVIAKLNGLTVVGSVSVGTVSGDNVITAAEAAAGTITVAVTFTNVANGVQPTVRLDGSATATSGITISTVSSNSATISITSAAAVALALSAHTLTVAAVDAGGITRSNTRSFTRTA